MSLLIWYRYPSFPGAVQRLHAQVHVGAVSGLRQAATPGQAQPLQRGQIYLRYPLSPLPH